MNKTLTRFLKVSFVCALAIIIFNISPCQSNASSLNGPYFLSCSLNDNNICVNISNTSLANSTNINLWQVNCSATQLFYTKYEGNGYYSIRSYLNTNMVLDVKGGKGYSGCNVCLYCYKGGNNQLWKFVKTGNEKEYYIVSKSGGFYLDVSGGKKSNGTNIQVYKGNKTRSQKFKFIIPYSVNNAVNYALAYTDTSGKKSTGVYNPVYHRFVNDTTNYISQCIWQGGLRSYSNWNRLCKKTSYNAKKHKAWTYNCSELYKYLTSTLHYKYYSVRSVTVNNTRRGDVVFLDTTGDGKPNLATICSLKKSGALYYCSHTPWRRNNKYNTKNYYHAWIIHMPF